jgi:hypothetical protein
MKHPYTRLHFIFRCFLFAAFVVIYACGDLSDVGQQSDPRPQAKATIVGAQSAPDADNRFTVRSGTEVLLSGKDSDGIDDPLLQFQWTQTDSSAYPVNLIERSRNSRTFTAPRVTARTELSFQLTVTDGDGVSASDQVSISIEPVADVDGFLIHPAANASGLTLLAAPDAGQMTGAVEETFEVQAEFIVHWRNRNDVYDALTIGSQTLSSAFPMNYLATSQVTDTRNPRLSFDIPQVDVDDINRHFETDNRERRLELYEIDSAFIEIRLSLVPLSTTVDFKIYAFDGTNLIAASDITSTSISGDSRFRATHAMSRPAVITTDPSAAALIHSSGGALQQSVYAEELKRELGMDNVQTARNYYKLLDPNDQFLYLKDWLKHAGFTDDYGHQIEDPSIAHAIYVNNYDLGFGRNMWTRVADNGNVYSYVVNYPSLEAAVQDQGDFAVVVMEYSENPDPNGSNAKIVKFYAYVPDKVTGGYIRAHTMNFDGRGEKALPGVCTTCHFQSRESLGRQFTSLDQADLDATFLPWDLDSFLYSSSTNAALVDPAYNQRNVEAVSQFDASREGQEAEFKKLNQAALMTYLDNPVNPGNPTGPRRYDASIELLHCMYGDAAMAEEPGVLPADKFDSHCVQPGWIGQEDLYHTVYARNCRACHTQFFNENDNISNFDSYSKFTSEAKIQQLKRYVFEQGRMPLARLTMDRFWVDFEGGTPAAERLRTHLASMGETVDTVPGNPVANLVVSGMTVTEDESHPNQVNVLGSTLTFDASDSLFTDAYLWSLSSSDCAQLPAINDATSHRISFALDSAAYFPCSFELRLNVSNEFTSKDQGYFFRATRVPQAEAFSVDLALASYVPGDSSIEIDILSQILQRGDDNLTILVTDSRVVNNNDGSVTFSLTSPLQGIDTSFNYTLEDADGTRSEQALIRLLVPEIKPSLSNSTPTASSVVLSWSVPDGFQADEFHVYRKQSSTSSFPGTPEASYSGSVFSHASNGLSANQHYDYKVVAVLGADSNDSDSISISTEGGTPSGLTATARTSDRISLSWSAGAGGAPDCYNIYENGFRVASCVASTSYTRTGLDANESYRYQISARFNSSESSLSTALNVNTLAVAPSITNIINGTSSVTVHWSDNVNQNNPSYQVYRGTSSGSLSQHGSTTQSKSLVSGVSSNTRYYFRVCVINRDAGQDCSSTESVRTVPTTSNIENLATTQGTCISCHSPKSNMQNRLNAGRSGACFYNGDFTLGDCKDGGNFNPMVGVGISADQEDALRLWILNGLPD